MTQFNAGDYITGVKISPYFITTSDAIMEVIETAYHYEEQLLKVKVIDHKFPDFLDVSEYYFVNPKYFRLSEHRNGIQNAPWL